MTYTFKTLVLAFVLVSVNESCRQVKYEIMDAKESQRVSTGSFVECKLIEPGAEGSDTVLYYRLNLDGTEWKFTQSPDLNIGFRVAAAKQERAVNYNYVYLATAATERTDTLTIKADTNSVVLVNYRKENGNKRCESSFGLGNDPKYPNPIWSKQVTNPKNMVNFIEIFHDELRKSLKHGKELEYTTVAHVGGYVSTTEMLVEFK